MKTEFAQTEKLYLPVGKRDHIQGPARAAVTLVEYADYQCPYCAEAHEIVKEIREQSGERLRFVFRNFPLSNVHEHAERAAQAAEAAAAQKKFWEMHDALFENQDALEDEDLVQYADDLGLDSERLLRELESGKYLPRVREDFESGVRSGVSGTPTFFINGVRFNGDYDSDEFLEALNRAASK